jgi:NAD(P) transhydrogenase
VPYEVGMARYRELTRGAIVGDSYGMLKLLVSTEDRTLLGVAYKVAALDVTDKIRALDGFAGGA